MISRRTVLLTLAVAFLFVVPQKAEAYCSYAYGSNIQQPGTLFADYVIDFVAYGDSGCEYFAGNGGYNYVGADVSINLPNGAGQAAYGYDSQPYSAYAWAEADTTGHPGSWSIDKAWWEYLCIPEWGCYFDNGYEFTYREVAGGIFVDLQPSAFSVYVGDPVTVWAELSGPDAEGYDGLTWAGCAPISYLECAVDTSTNGPKEVVAYLDGEFGDSVVINVEAPGGGEGGGQGGSGCSTPPPTPPTLAGPTTVIRGQTGTYTIQNLRSCAAVSMWRYITNDRGTVNRQSNTSSTQWSGRLVYDGTVSVVADGVTLTRAVSVPPRPNWEWAVIDAEKKPWGTTAQNGDFMNPPDPPTAVGQAVGMAVLFIVMSQPANGVEAIAGDGPNAGFKWVTKPFEQFSTTAATSYWWVISTALENTAGAFYQHQTGSYDAIFNNQGCISGSNLLTNAIRHESDPTEASHYSQYKNAMNNPNYNLGRVAEASVRGQDVTLEQFTDWLINSRMIQHRDDIINLTKNPEPPAPNSNASGLFLGQVNFPPAYTTCQ